MAPSNYYAYAKSQVMTSSPGELALLLYRGATRFSAKARLQIQNNEMEAAHNSLLRAQDIVLELMNGIRPGSDQITMDLFTLHNYIYRILCEANIAKRTDLIDEALTHLRGLLDTWEQIVSPSTRSISRGQVVTLDHNC